MGGGGHNGIRHARKAKANLMFLQVNADCLFFRGWYGLSATDASLEAWHYPGSCVLWVVHSGSGGLGKEWNIPYPVAA